MSRLPGYWGSVLEVDLLGQCNAEALAGGGPVHGPHRPAGNPRSRL